MIFSADGEPDTVAVRQAVHAVFCTFNRRFVESDTGTQLQWFGNLVRAAECDFISVAPVRRNDGTVRFAVDNVFGIFKHQLGFVKAAMTRPGHIAEQIGFVGGAVHTVNRQRLRCDNFYAGFFVRHITARSHCTQIPSTFCICAVRFPIGSAFQRMRYFGTIVHTHACAIVDVPHPRQLVAEAPIVAFYIGMTVSFTGRIDSNGTACLTGSQAACQLADGAGSIPVGVFAQFGFGILGNQTGTDGVLLIQFPCDYRLDGNGGQTQFVDVVAQYGIFFVFGCRAEGNVHAQTQSDIVAGFVRAIDVRSNGGFGNFAAGRAADIGTRAEVFRRFRLIVNAWKNDIGVDGNLAAVDFAQTGRVVENG